MTTTESNRTASSNIAGPRTGTSSSNKAKTSRTSSGGKRSNAVGTRRQVPRVRSSSEQDSSNNQRFRKLMLVLISAMGIAASMLVIWQFLPEGQQSVLQNLFNSTRSDTPDDDNDFVPSYQFMQCDGSKTDCCNGLSTLCDIPVDEVMFAGVHNAMASRDEGFYLWPNHHRRFEDALEAGYRAINLDLAKCKGDYVFIHGRCNLGSRSPVAVMNSLNDFLVNNPTEVLLLTIQINNDASGDLVDLNEFENLIANSVPGLLDRLYIRPEQQQKDQPNWPTLRTLIEQDTRLLLFHYNGPDCTAGSCPPGFYLWFSYAVETQFSFGRVGEIVDDTSTSCEITRGRETVQHFFGVNMFVTLPNSNAAETLNSKSTLQQHIETCSYLNNNLDVNVVWVDFWETGDLPEVVQLHNQGLAATRRGRHSRRFLHWNFLPRWAM